MRTLASGEGDAAPPFEPPAFCAPVGLAGERRALPPLRLNGALMAHRRTVRVHVRVSPAELAAWRGKAAAVGVPLSDLLRQAMAGPLHRGRPHAYRHLSSDLSPSGARGNSRTPTGPKAARTQHVIAVR